MFILCVLYFTRCLNCVDLLAQVIAILLTMDLLYFYVVFHVVLFYSGFFSDFLIYILVPPSLAATVVSVCHSFDSITIGLF